MLITKTNEATYKKEPRIGATLEHDRQAGHLSAMAAPQGSKQSLMSATFPWHFFSQNRKLPSCPMPYSFRTPHSPIRLSRTMADRLLRGISGHSMNGLRAGLLIAAMSLTGCAVPRETVEVPPGFSPDLCVVGPHGFPRQLTLEELKLCTRYNPVTGTMGHSMGGQMFHPSAWGKPFDLAPVPVKAR